MTDETVCLRLMDRTDGTEAGAVFWDDGWEAFGWRTASFTNGPYDTEDDALAALTAEFADNRALRLVRS